MIKGLKGRLFKRPSKETEVSVSNRKLSTLGEGLERYGEAAGLAQVGAQDMAQEVIRQEMQERPKILVVGNEESFSKPLVDYAVGFAKRMGYEIVALNCVPFGHEAPKVLTPYQEQLCKEFEAKACDGVASLICRAREEGIPCRHVVKFGPPDRCIREVHEELRRVEFVLTEPETKPEEGTEPAIPVFCLAN